MKRISLLCFVLGVLATSLQAQVSGFRGRHFLLKSDLSTLVLPHRTGRNLTLEVVALRNASLSFGYQEFQHDLREYTYFGIGGYKQEYSSLTVGSRTLFLEGRIYYHEGLPAPMGIYIYTRLAKAEAIFEGTTFDEFYNVATGQTQRYSQDFRLENLPGIQGELGFGSQWIMFDRFSFDLGGGFLISQYRDPSEEAKYASYLDTLIGPNLLNFNLTDLFSDSGGLGFTLHISVGLLLF